MELNTVTYGAMVKRGVVLIASFKGIAHKKFFVLIGEGEDEVVGFFFINSSMSRYVEQVEDFMAMQMHIKRTCYPEFLTHDSFVSAHKMTKIHKGELIRQIQAGQARYCGELTQDDLAMLLSSVRNSVLFPESYKNTFFKQ
jgi:hypothetical protein